jgi:8-oxo-dGTP pyrophosphatase MutT (NUDIX family)
MTRIVYCSMSRWIVRLAERIALTATPAPDDGRHRAAVAIVIHDASDGPHVLLMKRAERASDPWSGHISLPGGGHDPGDRDLLATAIREAREELALELEPARLLGNLAPLSPLSAGPHGVEVTPFVFVVDVALAARPGPEAVAAFWLPLSLAASGAIDGTYTYPGTGREFPCWTYEHHVIWGLTWRILCDLLALNNLA